MKELYAILERDGKPSWEFKWDNKFNRLTHVTRAGNVYAIMMGDQHKSLWIARLFGNAWCAEEETIKATKLNFENGGVYHFPI
jgi:hypothetical protein